MVFVKRTKSVSTQHGSLKVKLLGKDGAPLSIAELRQGLYELAHRLEPFQNYRAKTSTLYLTMVDQDGTPVKLERSGEWSIFPYRSFLDEPGASPSSAPPLGRAPRR